MNRVASAAVAAGFCLFIIKIVHLQKKKERSGTEMALEAEAVKVAFACGPGICDMDVATTTANEGTRIFVGGAEGFVKVGRACVLKVIMPL